MDRPRKLKLEEMWICEVPPMDHPPGISEQDLMVIGDEQSAKAYAKYQVENWEQPHAIAVPLKAWLMTK